MPTSNKPSVRTHRDLRIWQSAMDLVDVTYDLTQGFPTRENYGITAQMRRAAVSIPANLAEGHARNTTRDFLRFLSIAKGSLRELETLGEVGVRRRYLTKDQPEVMRSLTEFIGRMHTILCTALRRKLRPNP